MTIEDWKYINDYRRADSLASCYNCQYRNEKSQCMVASLNTYDFVNKNKVDFYVGSDDICDKYFGSIDSPTYAQKIQESGEFDSVEETLEHKRLVCHLLTNMAALIRARGETHDDSKLLEPERSIFTIFSRKLLQNKYGDPNYEKNKKLMSTALEHHYNENSHHPEHYPDGVTGMDLIDIIEMLVDWKAAGMRGPNGDIMKSIEMCSEKYGIEYQLMQILINTAERYLN